jgi:hypothetical protein
MNDDQLILLFNDFLTKIVEYNTKCKGSLEQIEKEVEGLRKQIGSSDSKSLMQLLWRIDESMKALLKEEGALKKASDFIDVYTKRGYTDQEVKDLGAHVEEVHEMYKFHKWFKSKAAIVLGVIIMLLTLYTCAEKITKAIELLQ